MNPPETAPISPRQWKASIRLRIRRGEPGSHVLQELVDKGCPPDQARQMVDDAVGSARTGPIAMIIIGIVSSLVAGMVTIGSYLAAASQPQGGMYLIWWGPVVFGLLLFFVGLARLCRIRW